MNTTLIALVKLNLGAWSLYNIFLELLNCSLLGNQVEKKMSFYRNQLETLPSDLSPSLKFSLLLDLRGVFLANLQSEVRRDVCVYEKKNSFFYALSKRTSTLRARFSYIRDLSATDQFEARYIANLRSKKRLLQEKYLKAVVQGAADFISFHRQCRGELSKVVASMVRHHQALEQELKRREQLLERERMRMLMEDNEDEYRKLVKEKKDSRLAYLLNQTDAYVQKFKELVKARQQGRAATGEHKNREVQDAVEAPDVAPPNLDDADDDRDDERGRQRSYYMLAHSLGEEVLQQPSILVGGLLKPYQMKGLEWLVSLFNNNLNGILADEMGLGKTIQSISLIAYLHEVKQFKGPYLLAVPLSTISNWRIEFQKWAPSIPVLVYKGKPHERKYLQSKLRTSEFEVCLTTYEFIMKDKSSLGRVKWQYLIVDEGHRIKNKDAKLTVILADYYKIPHRLLLTGTPLQNSLPELWALMNFLLPDIFNSCQTFEDWFNRPFANTGEKAELNAEETILVIRGLHKVLRPFLLRRLKSEVEAQLPQKQEYVIKVGMTPLQQRLYDRIKSKIIVTEGLGGQMKTKSLNNTLVQLRKCCNHPYLFEDVEEMMPAEFLMGRNLYRVSGKFELLDRTFEKLRASGHRVLVFCQMTRLMSVLEDYFEWKAYKYLRLDGSTSSEKRDHMLSLFNAERSEYFVFMLSTRAGGLGLNLQSADTVSLYLIATGTPIRIFRLKIEHTE
jgi:SNF2 family DNA or RNA helicase